LQASHDGQSLTLIDRKQTGKILDVDDLCLYGIAPDVKQGEGRLKITARLGGTAGVQKEHAVIFSNRRTV
jgi:hypothetical protein